MQSPLFVTKSPVMQNLLSEVIALLRPSNVFSKEISGAGRWGVRYSSFGHPSFCVVLEGSCLLAVDGEATLTLEQGDFLLMSSTPGFTISGFEAATPLQIDPAVSSDEIEEVRHGNVDGDPDVRLLGGYFEFDSPDAALLVSLLPTLVHIRKVERLSSMVKIVNEECKAQRPGRDSILTRLIEVLLIEALRLVPGEKTSPGLLRGLADPRLALAIRNLHNDPSRAWTVAEMAKQSMLSRSAFFQRFTQALGMSPMQYLLAWRMAIAQGLLRQPDLGIAKVAEQVGYGSASAFSTAFTRYCGQPPSEYSRAYLKAE